MLSLQRWHALSAGLSLTLMAATLPAWAQYTPYSDGVRLSGGRQEGGIVGAGIVTGPRYLGSDQSRTQVRPLLEYQWANGWFAGVGNGIGYNASSTPGLAFGPRLTVDFGRREDRSDALHGMGNLDTQAELGGFVSYAILPALAVNASLRAGIGDRKGVRLDLGISHGFQLAAGWRLRLSAGTTFANKDTLQAYFGVTPAQSLTSGYTVYTPKAGIEDVRVGASLSYALAPRTTMTAGLTARTLQSQAKDSPLVRKASSVSGLLGLGYAF